MPSHTDAERAKNQDDEGGLFNLFARLISRREELRNVDRKPATGGAEGVPAEQPQVDPDAPETMDQRIKRLEAEIAETRRRRQNINVRNP